MHILEAEERALTKFLVHYCTCIGNQWWVPKFTVGKDHQWLNYIPKCNLRLSVYMIKQEHIKHGSMS